MDNTNIWKHVTTIPQYLVQSVGDSGMVEYETCDPNENSVDDLRVHLELSGGTFVLLPSKSRIVINTDGDFVIQIRK